MTNPFASQLFGKNAFYNTPEYKKPAVDLLSPKPDYVVKSVKPTEKVPTSLWQTFVHKAVGLATAFPGQFAAYCLGNDRVKHITQIKEAGFEVKRVRVDFNERQIDAFIIGKKRTLNNKRWTVFFGGLGEKNLETPNQALLEFARGTKSNLVLFNYAGYGASSSECPTEASYLDSARAVIEMVQDNTRGLGAKKLCLFGSSLGGGILGSLLEKHPDIILDRVKYVVVKDRSFSSIDSATAGVFTTLAKNLNLPFDTTKDPILLKTLACESAWSFSSLNSSKALTHIHEIVLQHAKQPSNTRNKSKNFTPYKLSNHDQLESTDNMISKEASMAYAMLSDPEYPMDRKTILGAPDKHFACLSRKTAEHLARRVSKIFKSKV